ncbi:tumor protein p53-inducible protein 13, partial [Pseudonaja textilis]|uniref:tumor protein p53-inducible protein 13 n=1 Tax=Pseudonaja textilis TaxID=8673 RepID=UPI000EA912F9
PLTWIPRGSTFHTAKVEVAFAAPGLDTRLHRRWLPKGTGGGACPGQQKLLPLWERLPIVQPLWAHGRRRRAVFLPRPAPSGTKRLASKAGRAPEDQSRLTSAWLNFRAEKDPWKLADLARRTLQNLPGSASVVPGHGGATKRGARPPLPTATTDAGAAHKAGCRCPDSQRATVVAQEAEARPEGLRVPTPRTEEATWAASALIFLLVLLTLAILYTRLHRKCRRGPSLYWMTSSEEGRETVA